MSRITTWIVTGVVAAAAVGYCYLPESDHESKTNGVVEVNLENFDALVSDASRLVLLNFWTADCPPSLEHESILRRVAEKYDGELVVGNVNLDEHQSIGHRCRIQRIPTLILMKNRKILSRDVGVHTEDMIDFKIANTMSGFLPSEQSSKTPQKPRNSSAIQEGPVR